MRILGIMSCAAVVAAVCAGTLHAQEPPAGASAGTSAAPIATTFEVASVKPSHANASGPLANVPLIRPPAGGRFIATNVPLRVLVRVAYGVEDFQISGGPSWQLSQKFDITAKAPDGLADNMTAVLPMLKALLADRFKLKMHTETKEMPAYSLVVAHSDGTLGPEMKPSTSDCANADTQKALADTFAKGGPAALAARIQSGETIPCSVMPARAAGPGFSMSLRGNGQPMATLLKLLTNATGRVVQDKTGLTGRYDWTLTFDPQVLLAMASQVGVTLPPAAAALPPSDSPALLTAIQEQLGLRLDSTRAPVEMLIIDSASMPDAD